MEEKGHYNLKDLPPFKGHEFSMLVGDRGEGGVFNIYLPRSLHGNTESWQNQFRAKQTLLPVSGASAKFTFWLSAFIRVICML